MKTPTYFAPVIDFDPKLPMPSSGPAPAPHGLCEIRVLATKREAARYGRTFQAFRCKHEADSDMAKASFVAVRLGRRQRVTARVPLAQLPAVLKAFGFPV